MDLSTLRGRGEELRALLSRAYLRQRTGLQDEADLSGIYAQFEHICSNEAWALARENLERASDPEGLERARRLARFVADTRAERREAARIEERLAFEARSLVRFEGEEIALREADERVSAEPDRGRRAQLARTRDSALGSLDSRLAALIDLRHETASELGQPSYPALLAFLAPLDLSALAAEATATLASTRDAWRDLLGFGLRRLVGPVAPRPRGEAAMHDLERFARLEAYDELFQARGLPTAARRFHEWMGLSLAPGGAVRLGLEKRPRKRAGAFAAPLAVPGDIVAALRPTGGAADYSSLFAALGRAQRLALLEPDAPFEERWLGGESAQAAFGLAFENLLLDERFLQRLLEADSHEALEAARFLAIERLGRLRMLCARLGYESTLYAEGARSGLEGLYRESMQKASLCDWPTERWLWDFEPGLAVAFELRGWSLEATLHQALLERADEDYWRNPRTGPLLRQVAVRSQRLGAEALAAELGGSLTLEKAATRLVVLASR